MIARRLVLSAALLLALPAAAQNAKMYSVKKDASSLTYKLIHKMHTVSGKAPPSEGKAVLKPDGTLQVAVRAQVKDFDSQNSNRDTHMLEVTEASKFPLVEVKAVGTGVKTPATFPASVPVTLKGKLTFHGVTKDVEIPMTVKFDSATQVTADGSFKISLEGFNIERPTLLLVKVEDELVLEPHLVFAEGT
ncbi:YceI family protein [Corallococcus exercitus]|uniref:YceI family protein n=1 Tax=Corallococcus exercitus TaxID=2316736 RepID=A0A3A8IUX1_9BACT|nr:YceI family protein [Corallococcus exercitus]NOK33279.1 YceI family protein [Corallococcus exercitus]RKG82091.1 YceI family protein [Corallococcus exercitus]